VLSIATKINSSANNEEVKRVVVYPNPLKEGENIRLQFIDQKAGTYQVRLYNYLGQVVFNSTVSISDGDSSYQLSTQDYLASGFYHLEVTTNDGVRLCTRVLIQ
jgi:Secretion system C-terminal sorting domain